MLKLLVIMVVTMFIAFLIETLVEYLFAPFFNNISSLKKFKWLQMYIAMAIGLVAAFIYNLDLIYLLAQFLSEISGTISSLPVTEFGIIVTGAAIGRGSNFLHDLYDKYFTKAVLEGISIPLSQSNASSEDK